MKTIKEAIIEVLKRESRPLSAQSIYEKIIENNLYKFNSKTPASIVNSELRKNCKGIELKKSNKIKCFEQVEQGKFFLIK